MERHDRHVDIIENIRKVPHLVAARKEDDDLELALQVLLEKHVEQRDLVFRLDRDKAVFERADDIRFILKRRKRAKLHREGRRDLQKIIELRRVVRRGEEHDLGLFVLR